MALVRAVVNQGAPGPMVLAAAQAGQKHKVMAFWLGMANNGSLQFTDGSGPLMGPVNQQSNTPSIPFSSGSTPFVETALGSALNLVSTGGAAKGVVVILTEP